MASISNRTYLPAAGHDVFLPLYDLITALIGADKPRRSLLERSELANGSHVLDIGCGTGTLVTLIKKRHPRVEVIGLDPDPKALARATRKASREALPIRFDQGFSDSLPYVDASFDRVFSSYMFHHLEDDSKERTLRDVRRVLKPGGRFYLLDFETPEHGFHRSLFHSHHRLKDNAPTRIIELLNKAGFTSATKLASHKVLLGFARAASYEAMAA
jgi:ubiquinone/menaquinone biosynthesis C-methylase UbiE